MKKLLYTILSLALTVTTGVKAADKIAVANMSSIFQQLPQRAIVAKQLEKEFKNHSTALQNQEMNLQTKMQKLQRDGSTMRASDRSRMEKDIMTQREAFSRKARIFEQVQSHRQMEERNKLLTLIQHAVKKVAESEGYNVVIDTNALAYVSNVKDITAEILKQVK